MSVHFDEILRFLLALAAGGLIGVAFGTVQQAARRRYEKRRDEGTFGSGWAIMPGSMTRVAMLLIALTLIQIVCPLLFVGGTQWWVSGGLLAGYGWTLLRQVRSRRREILRREP